MQWFRILQLKWGNRNLKQILFGHIENFFSVKKEHQGQILKIVCVTKFLPWMPLNEKLIH